MGDSPLIELEHVSYVQGRTDILRDVTWRLQPGQHWAVIGPNGSGKTTLLRLACGYLWPTAGAVRRLGEELIDLSRLRRSVGWVTADLAPQIPPQEPAIATVVSGKLAMVGLRWLGGARPERADFAAARRLLESINCGGLIDKPFGVLSQGERQQVLIARARMVDPLLIVLDEPCAGMDPGVRERFLAWLNKLAAAEDGCAIVLATHHLEEIMPAFEQALVLQNGRIAAAGPTRQVITPRLMAEVYGLAVDRLEESGSRLWPIWHADDRRLAI
ncbi:MAG: molybdenum ABC transporter ATP-binding protein [Planctomycetota bacterium]|nr:MAG: molybdenum ABC transporter ATP-binding protein [Planctomycetota bacterium]